MDKLDAVRRSSNMRKIRSCDTKPEMLVRKRLHGLGFRYRLYRPDLPGRPDLVFPSRKKVIFVNGCFWHQHPDQRCLDYRIPQSNRAYWVNKLNNNLVRDDRNYADLVRLGWKILIIWECETSNMDDLSEKIVHFLAM
jgi:DNA mismatch endonuclease (patch repair protein)